MPTILPRLDILVLSNEISGSTDDQVPIKAMSAETNIGIIKCNACDPGAGTFSGRSYHFGS